MKNTVFVGNLSFNVTKGQVQDFFAQFGSVTEVSIPVDRETQKSRGFAFVKFETEQDAQKALTTDGKRFEGRNIRVSFAHAR